MQMLQDLSISMMNNIGKEVNDSSVEDVQNE